MEMADILRKAHTLTLIVLQHLGTVALHVEKLMIVHSNGHMLALFTHNPAGVGDMGHEHNKMSGQLGADQWSDA